MSIFQEDRNKAIYTEYINTDTSFNLLARKYCLSSQRVAAIIKDFKNRGLDKSLDVSAPISIRESLKNKAVELREQGKYIFALKLFEQVEEWDKVNKNYTGLNDLYGHIYIVYKKLADKETNPKKKFDYLSDAKECLLRAISLQDTGQLSEDALKITNVHLASLNISMAEAESSETDRTVFLNESIQQIDNMLTNFPGSAAHKAWPLKIKAQAQHLLGKSKEAIQTLQLAESYIYEGYESEVNKSNIKVSDNSNAIGNDQASLKLLKWLLGLHLTYMRIYKDTNRNILAKHYAYSVIAMKDPEGLMKVAKKEAKAVLQQL